MANDQVGPAVVVEVAHRQPAADRRPLEERSAAAAHIPEHPSASLRLVVQQQRALLERAPTDRVVDDMAVDDREVFPAVVVDIDEACAEGDPVLTEGGDAGGAGLVMERLLTEIAIQVVQIALEVRD